MKDISLGTLLLVEFIFISILTVIIYKKTDLELPQSITVACFPAILINLFMALIVQY